MLDTSRASAILIALIAAVPCSSQESVATVFKRVSTSVVDVVTVQDELAGRGQVGWVKSAGLGSGFVISADGLVVTAAHVVQTAEDVQVRFVGGLVVPASILASDQDADVALLRVEQVPDGVVPVPLGDSDLANVGDQVLIVGAPFGISHTLTVGHISARRRSSDVFGSLRPADLLQTDAAINKGNSGGPMFSMSGEVIGVVSHIVSSSGTSAGLGFVITSNLARKVLLEEPSMWSGMTGHYLEGDMARLLNLPQSAGVLVQRVVDGSPAAALGLRPGTVRARIGDQDLVLGGDVILAIQGIEVGSSGSDELIRQAIARLGRDDRLSLSILRGGVFMRLSKQVQLLE